VKEKTRIAIRLPEIVFNSQKGCDTFDYCSMIGRKLSNRSRVQRFRVQRLWVHLKSGLLIPEF